MPTAGEVSAEVYTICLSQLEHEFATDRSKAAHIRSGFGPKKRPLFARNLTLS